MAFTSLFHLSEKCGLAEILAQRRRRFRSSQVRAVRALARAAKASRPKPKERHRSKIAVSVDQKSARILLWDIDGTILRSAKVTTFTEYTRPVLEAVFGTTGRIDDVPVTGKTDLQFIAE